MPRAATASRPCRASLLLRASRATSGASKAGIALVGWLCVAIGQGCGTSSVAPQGCRAIEQARCRQAAKYCPNFGITDATRLQVCLEAARDRCLHGMAISPEPSEVVVQSCVGAIEETVECAVIAAPETTPACGFLVPSAAPDAGPATTLDAGPQTLLSVEAGSDDASTARAGL